MKLLKRAWAEIDLNALAFNLEQIRSVCAGKEVVGVVKANAYGHSDEICAAEYYSLGVRTFAVSSVWEGEAVRRVLPYEDAEIMVFGYIYEPFLEEIISLRLTPTVGSVEYAHILDAFAASRNAVIPVQLAADTGMTRVGVRTAEEVDEIFALKNIKVVGGYSHFPVADCLDEKSVAFTKMQAEKICGLFCGRNVPLHCQNSGGIVFHQDFSGDMARPGLILYGYAPNTSVKTPIPLKQVMTLKSAVNQLKVVPKGVDIGYGRTYTTDSEQLIAVIPIGYADGYSRLMSNKGKIAVNGVLCPIRGRVCMDQLMLDVTNVPGVRIGDEALVYSDRFKETSIDYISDMIGTISNEVICAVSARVPRVAVKNGEVVKVVRYR